MSGHVVSPAELQAEYARPVQGFCDAIAREGLAGNRTIVAALVLATLRGYRFGRTWREDPGTRMFRTLAALFLCMSAIGWVLMSSGLEIVYRPTINTDIGFYSMTILGVICLLAIRLLWSFPSAVTLWRRRPSQRGKPQIAGFCLGKIDQILDSRSLRLGVFSFGFLLVMQVTLLGFTRDHCGINFDGNFVTSLLLTLDNLFHGVLLDICELYGLNLAGQIEHNYWSASFFLFFRLGYDAMVLMFVYLAWQRWTARRLLPVVPANSAELIRWLETGLDKKWFQRFPCEYTFLVLVKEYLAGRYDVVRTISERFDDLSIADEVRALFVDERGEQVFLPIGRTEPKPSGTRDSGPVPSEPNAPAEIPPSAERPS